MVLTIHYPASAAENFAKGTATDDVYFEVPAVFNEDGTCDEPATLEKVDQHLAFLESMRT
jgi:hypothetical protein